VRDDRYEALYLLALTTAMREGKLLGLRWQDVDLGKATLQVRMNVQKADGRFIVGETKTAYSRRNISLTWAAVEALRRHRGRGWRRHPMLPCWSTAPGGPSSMASN
jgi:integrase